MSNKTISNHDLYKMPDYLFMIKVQVKVAIIKIYMQKVNPSFRLPRI